MSFIETTLAQLTLEEKAQLIAGYDEWHTHPIPRLDLPLLRLSDGPNGVRGTRFFNGSAAATFPCGSALAATFDKALMTEAGRLMGKEARHKGAHAILGPTCNMPRSPVGGQNFGTFSEDPVHSGIATACVIRGIQAEGVAATIKHFICNDMEGDRLCINVQVSQRALRETYLLPFQIAIRDSDPKALMTSYQKINGTHVSQSTFLLQKVLREEWQWKGLVLSDWMGCYSLKELVDAGLDLEMPGPPVMRAAKALVHAVQTNEIHEETLNLRVRAMVRFIEFCKQSGIPENAPEGEGNNTPETAAWLRKIAADAVVLLKNEAGVLPLKPTDSIAVIGPNAKISFCTGGGSTSVRPYYTVTPYDGICAKHKGNVPYTIGATSNKMLPALGPQLRRADGTVGFTAKFYLEPRTSPNRTLIDSFALTDSYLYMNDYTNAQFTGDVYVDFEGSYTAEVTGVHEFGVAVFGDAQLFVDDVLVVDNKTNHVQGDLFFSRGSVEEKGRLLLQKNLTYAVRVELGSPNTSIHYQGNQLIQGGAGGIQFGGMALVDAQKEIDKAVALAKQVDKVVMVIGLTQEWEAEGYDRKDMKLPGFTDRLVAAVAAVNPNVVVVNQSGCPVELPWVDQVKGIVHAWIGGNELGNGIADVLYGDVNPSGKLCISWPKRMEDNPCVLSFKSNKGHVWYGEDIYVGYKYYEKVGKGVLYPFGFGLSYTQFCFLDLTVKRTGDDYVVSVTVKNVGERAGATVIQVYFGAVSPSLERPVKELKEFEKVLLPAGGSKRVGITVPVKYALAFFDEYYQQWSCEEGDYMVSVGDSSGGALLTAVVTVEEGFRWKGL